MSTCRGHFTPSENRWKFLLEMLLVLIALRNKVYCCRQNGEFLGRSLGTGLMLSLWVFQKSLSVLAGGWSYEVFYLPPSAGLWPEFTGRAEMQHSVAGDRMSLFFPPFSCPLSCLFTFYVLICQSDSKWIREYDKTISCISVVMPGVGVSLYIVGF